MKMEKAMSIINEEPKGFMVAFEWKEGSILKSDYFPEKYDGEPLIETEEEAWRLAYAFAYKMRGKVVNLYVVNHDHRPVLGYKNRYINNR